MTPHPDPARVAAAQRIADIRYQLEHYPNTPDDFRFLLEQLDRAEAERDKALEKGFAEGNASMSLSYHRVLKESDTLRAQVAAAREALKRLAIQVTPEEYEEEGGAEMTDEHGIECMEWMILEARQALTRLDAQAEKPGARGAPEPQRGET